MRVLVAGAGQVGTKVLLQLKKNPKLEVLTVDPRENPPAVQEGIIPEVDFREKLTLTALEEVIKQAKPDLVLVTTSTEDMGLGRAPGVDIYVETLRAEVASIVDVPVIGVARTI
jgi:ketopantoate reductase